MIDRNALLNAVEQVERGLQWAEAERGPHDWQDKSWQARRNAITARLKLAIETALGARVADDWNGARVRILGIASTSTSGLDGALHNWIRAARLRMDKSAEAA